MLVGYITYKRKYMFDMQLPSPLMTQKAAAEYLGTRVASLNAWRSRNLYNIPFVRWGHNIRYRKEDLDTWIQTQIVQPNNQ